MRRLWTQLLAAIVVAIAFTATPASAQATRTWVSGVGDDANPCSRTAPCKTFAGAISKTAATGEINCLDSGGFGGVTITKAITISCTGVTAGVLVSGSNAITINAGSSDRVVIDGLFVDGLGTSFTGISVISARDVVIRNTNITGFTTGILVNGTNQNATTVENAIIFNSGTGVRVQSAAGNGAARIYDSLIVANSVAGVSVTGAGNRIEISGNQIIRTPKSLDITSGGVVNSYGNNVLTAGDAPTLVPLG